MADGTLIKTQIPTAEEEEQEEADMVVAVVMDNREAMVNKVAMVRSSNIPQLFSSEQLYLRPEVLTVSQVLLNKTSR